MRFIMLILVGSLWPLQAMAMDYYLSGFGTLGVSCFDNENADFRKDDVPKGPGRSNDCTAELDSKLGVQLDLGLTQELEATLQLTAIHNADDNFKPQVTLANIRWEASDNLQFRVGRMQNPNFLYSEFRNVSYAQPWVRPPGEVYNVLPTFLHDGVEALYMYQHDEWLWEFHLGLAQSDFKYPVSNSSESLDVNIQTSYLNVTAKKGPWTFKAGVAPSRSDASSPMIDTLLAGLRASGESALANDLEINDSPYTLYSAGFLYDDSNWLISGEVATRPTEGFVYQPTAAYLSVAKRMGLWTPYVTLAVLNGKQDDAYNTLSPADPLYDAVEQLLSSTHDVERKSLSLGIARELGEQSTLKVQVDFIQPDKNSFGDYINHHPTDYNFADPDLDTLFSVNIDFVF